jgi:prephenate dehydrogenase
MMLDILMTNQEEVLKAVATCQAQLDLLAHLVGNGDEEALRNALSAIRGTRLEMFP